MNLFPSAWTHVVPALASFPVARQQLQSGNREQVTAFVQEVRRYDPFFPFFAACVRNRFEWNELQFWAGRRVLFDLYGTNRDPEWDDESDAFRPERILERTIDAYELVPQGGGDRQSNHRCAGEELTIELMQLAVGFLMREFTYDVTSADVSLDMRRLPALPRDGFRICHRNSHCRGQNTT